MAHRLVTCITDPDEDDGHTRYARPTDTPGILAVSAYDVEVRRILDKVNAANRKYFKEESLRHEGYLKAKEDFNRSLAEGCKRHHEAIVRLAKERDDAVEDLIAARSQFEGEKRKLESQRLDIFLFGVAIGCLLIFAVFLLAWHA